VANTIDPKNVNAKAKICLFLSGLLTGWPAISLAQEFTTGHGWQIQNWSLQTSLYTKHLDPEPDHVNDQNLIALEAGFANQWIGGLALFDNSFGQETEFLYMARRWPLFRSQHWYTKLMGGLMHGYEEPYEDKIPLNGLGVAPAIIPALGFEYNFFVGELHLGGLAVVTFTAGFRF
jgi:hypothetical protein